MAKPSTIQEWLDSKERYYNEGVKLYAEHPTALRGLVNNLQRKQTTQMEEKLVYVLEKALAADGDGSTETLKKKGKTGAKGKKPVTENPTQEEQTPPPMANPQYEIRNPKSEEEE
jgi:hypothetical protein